MRIEEVRATTLRIPFREPFTSGRLRWDHRRVTLLSLRTDTDIEGLGEFAAAEADDLGEDISPQLAPMLEGIDLHDPVRLEGAIRALDRWPFVGRVARAAVESAVLDVMTRAAGVTVAASMSTRPADGVAVNALIGLVSTRDAVAMARRCVRHGFRTLKLKGGDEPAGALGDRVRAVREACGPDVAIRVDCNGSLPVRDAPRILAELARSDLEYVEQPIAARAGISALARLRADTDVRIAADEAVRDLGSARSLIELEAVDALVLKPARVGGLRQARSIAELAIASAVPVTLSTGFETGVGIAGALQVATTVPGAHAHGLATGGLLESDLLERSLALESGRMGRPRGPGLGVTVDVAAVARYRVA